MHAIGHRVIQDNLPQRRLPHVREVHERSFHRRCRTTGSGGFRNRYVRSTLLPYRRHPVPAGKETTQEEFFHTFNALTNRKRQLIIRRTVRPRNSNARSAFALAIRMGLAHDIQAPDLETASDPSQEGGTRTFRCRRSDVVHREGHSVQHRELEGALIRVIAYASLTQSADYHRPGGPTFLKSAARAAPCIGLRFED